MFAGLENKCLLTLSDHVSTPTVTWYALYISLDYTLYESLLKDDIVLFLLYDTTLFQLSQIAGDGAMGVSLKGRKMPKNAPNHVI